MGHSTPITDKILPMRLDQMIEGTGLRLQGDGGQTIIRDLTDDSRQVEPGWAFVARKGSQLDGHCFIPEAVQRGAVAIIAQEQFELPPQVAQATGTKINPVITAKLAERFFEQPSSQLRLIGVTGTNGKTTTACLTQHLLQDAGTPTGLIGTLYTDDLGPAGRKPSKLTTPPAIELSRILARMVRNGCRAVVLEVSSHAAHQGRTAALEFDAAVFTNLTSDHLDYHQNLEAYAAAKALLFEQLGRNGWAILNADDLNAKRMVRDSIAQRFWTTVDMSATGTKAGCRAEILELTAQFSRARLDGPWGSTVVSLPLIGRHNIANALQAAAAAQCITNIEQTLRGSLEHCPSIPGRLERVDCQPNRMAGQKTPAVLVDYAHTYDALDKVLTTLKPITPGQLIILFGCGGDRDKTKRPKMGQVASRLADRLWITSDNPRMEDPDRIIREILEGVPQVKREKTRTVPDRAQAIRDAVLSAEPTDTVLLAGKGHEDYQIVGTNRHPFDDSTHAADALDEWVRRQTKQC